MKLRNSGKAAIVISALVGSSQLLAEGQNIEFYGSLETAYNSYTRKKIDTTNSDVATAYTATPGEKGPAKDENYADISSGYATSQFGLDYTASDKVTGTLEFAVGMGNAAGDQAPAVRRYFLDADLGAGVVKFGRDTRIFYDVAGAADNFSMANSTYAGVVYGEERATGISYNSGDLLGPATVRLGLVNPTTGTVESKPKGGNPGPGVEAAVSVGFGDFGINLGLVNEKRTYNFDAAAGTWDVAPAMAYSAAFTASVAMVDAVLVYTGGDALYDNVSQGATLTKDQNDKMSAFALNVSASLGQASVGVYYGTETLTHDMKNKALAKNIDDVGTSMGLSVGYDWHGVTWTAEAVNTTRTFDGQTVRDDMYGAIGAMTSFKS